MLDGTAIDGFVRYTRRGGYIDVVTVGSGHYVDVFVLRGVFSGGAACIHGHIGYSTQEQALAVGERILSSHRRVDPTDTEV